METSKKFIQPNQKYNAQTSTARRNFSRGFIDIKSSLPVLHIVNGLFLIYYSGASLLGYMQTKPTIESNAREQLAELRKYVYNDLCSELNSKIPNSPIKFQEDSDRNIHINLNNEKLILALHHENTFALRKPDGKLTQLTADRITSIAKAEQQLKNTIANLSPAPPTR